MTTIVIVVAAKPNGLSSDNGVNITFPQPNKYVNSQGDITVPANEQPLLQFQIAQDTSTISWKNGNNTGTFEVGFSLGAGTDGKDALWISETSKPKSKQWSSMFSGPALSLDGKTLGTTDYNTSQTNYYYCLNVGVVIPGAKPLVYALDPRIINHGRNFNRPIFLIVVAVVLIAAAFLAVRALWG